MIENECMDELFAILQITRTQQEAVQVAVQGLQAERAALVRERTALIELASVLRASASDVLVMAGGVAPMLQKVSSDAIERAMAEALTNVEKAAESALGAASLHAIERLAGAARAAREAQDGLSGLSVKLALFCAGAAAAGAVTGALVIAALLGTH